MKLHRLSKDGPPVSLRLKVPGEVHSALTSYARYYEHQHGEAIEIPDLVMEIVRTFVSVDREFRTWQRNGRGPEPPTADGQAEGQEGSR